MKRQDASASGFKFFARALRQEEGEKAREAWLISLQQAERDMADRKGGQISPSGEEQEMWLTK